MLLDHILDLLNGSVVVVASEVEKDTQRGDFASPIQRSHRVSTSMTVHKGSICVLLGLELPESLSNGHTHGVAVLVRYGDVHVGREVAAMQLGSKVLVHVEGIIVDVQLMAIVSIDINS